MAPESKPTAYQPVDNGHPPTNPLTPKQQRGPTPVSTIGTIVDQLRHNWKQTRALHNVEFRKSQLRALARLMHENQDRICEALYMDLHKSRHNVILAETGLITNEIAEALYNMDTWSKPMYPARKLINWMDSVAVRKVPLGVVLVIAPWNYPFQLTMSPFVSAIAAGNACILKPSEIAMHTAQLIAELVPQYLDQRFFQVILGGVPETTELLKCKFDHIFYTGNGTVAKVVMTAAAKHLTPVALELGGKTPAVILPCANLHNAARRIAFGKLMNCGQTCIAPDYILISKNQQAEFVEELKVAITEFYGVNAQLSPEYGRIINTSHFDRLAKYKPSFDKPMPDDRAALDAYGGQAVIGGPWDRTDLYIPPTVVKNVGRNALIMEDEIFGPILPIIPMEPGQAFTEQAAELIGGRAHALALYVFGTTDRDIQWLLDNTQTGGVTVNDTIMHCATPGVPFGGVGESGMGACHGKFGFDTFSHSRAVLHRPAGLEFMNSIRYPPLSDNRIMMFKQFALAKI